jgi:hypothetical protein
MKNLIFFFFLAGLASSCRKDENKIYFEGGTDPVLTSSRPTNTVLPLAFEDADEVLLSLNWTNPNYIFTTGSSSHNVTYQIEIDTAGANFTNPQKQTVAVSNELSKSFTVGEFNDFLLNQLLLDSTMTHQVQIRVRSSIGNAVPKYSNVFQYTVKPYAIPPKVNPPSTGKLFITGSATPASWQCGCGEAELASQQFTKISPTLYELTITLTGDGSYLLLPQYGSWSAKYGGTGGNNTNDPYSMDFKAEGSDLKAPPLTANYKIVVDFQRGKITVTKI